MIRATTVYVLKGCTFMANRTYAGVLMYILKRCSSTSVQLYEWNLWRMNSRGEAAEGGGRDNYNDTCIRRMQNDYANVKRFLDPACRVRSEHVGAA